MVHITNMLMNREVQEDKMEHNEDQALLRAKTSIDKQQFGWVDASVYITLQKK